MRVQIRNHPLNSRSKKLVIINIIYILFLYSLIYVNELFNIFCWYAVIRLN